MAEEIASFESRFDFLNDQNNEEAGNSPGETATDQKNCRCDRNGEKSAFV